MGKTGADESGRRVKTKGVCGSSSRPSQQQWKHSKQRQQRRQQLLETSVTAEPGSHSAEHHVHVTRKLDNRNSSTLSIQQKFFTRQPIETRRQLQYQLQGSHASIWFQNKTCRVVSSRDMRIVQYLCAAKAINSPRHRAACHRAGQVEQPGLCNGRPPHRCRVPGFLLSLMHLQKDGVLMAFELENN